MFFALENKLNIDAMPISYEVTTIKSFDNFFVLFGERIVTLTKKQITLFEYMKPESEANGSTIDDVFFNQNTRQMIVVWDNDFIQHFDTDLNILINEFTNVDYFICFSESLQLVVFAV